MSETGICYWKEDECIDFAGNWDTNCGERFILEDGTPIQNKMHFCCYCGKPLVEVPYVEKSESEDTP